MVVLVVITASFLGLCVFLGYVFALDNPFVSTTANLSIMTALKVLFILRTEQSLVQDDIADNLISFATRELVDNVNGKRLAHVILDPDLWLPLLVKLY